MQRNFLINPLTRTILVAFCIIQHHTGNVSHAFNLHIVPTHPHSVKQEILLTSFQRSSTMSIQNSLYSSQLSSSSSADETPEQEQPEKPDLVDQSTYIAAIELVNREISKANGMEYTPDDNPDVAYAIGRLQMDMNMPVGIDLIETPDLVLINGIDLEAQEKGVKPLDTIVSVSTVDGKFQEKTMGLNMDDTVAKFKAVMNYAKENGETEIHLELNRLIKGFYGEK